MYRSSTTSSILRSRSASARSLVFSTVNSPFSICSMTSPMRSASRAAQEMARVGVASAEGSRWRGFAGSSLAGFAGSKRSAIRAIRSVKKMNTMASTTLKLRWNITTSCAASRARRLIGFSRKARNGTRRRQPISLNRKLPSVTRRASGGAFNVDSIPRRPLPRFAPSTSPSATGSPTTCSDASAAISSTTARLE